MSEGKNPKPGALAWAISNFELEKARRMAAEGISLFDDPSIDVVSIFEDISGDLHHRPAECFAIVEFLVEQGYGQALYDDIDQCSPSASDDPIKYYLEESAREKTNYIPGTVPWQVSEEFLTATPNEDARPAAMAWAINSYDLVTAKQLAREGVDLRDDPSIPIVQLFMVLSLNPMQPKQDRIELVEFLLAEGYGEELLKNEEAVSYAKRMGWDNPIDQVRGCAETGWHTPDPPDPQPRPSLDEMLNKPRSPQ